MHSLSARLDAASSLAYLRRITTIPAPNIAKMSNTPCTIYCPAANDSPSLEMFRQFELGDLIAMHFVRAIGDA